MGAVSDNQPEVADIYMTRAELFILYLLFHPNWSEKSQLAGTCSISTYGKYMSGTCTTYGACRVGNKDFMYQGGCGELSLWGENNISGDFECKIWNGKEREIFVGRCSSEGHCVRESQAISLYNPNCIALTIRDNITRERTFQAKKKNKKVSNFLGTMFSFLGGLGNALSFTTRFIWT